MTDAYQRLATDYAQMKLTENQLISAAPVEGDMLTWKCNIFGPPDTIWEGGKFHVILKFTTNYPIDPPTARFTTQMFHPNVSSSGNVCIDILQSRWNPTYTVRCVLIALQLLLDDPNPGSPANSIAGGLFTQNREEYIRRVRAIVEQSKSQK
jgi:ubiquitin-conjugating enzyme E2 A